MENRGAPILIRSWPDKGTGAPGRLESLQYWESHVSGDFSGLNEVLGAFQSTFLARKEATLMARIPESKRSQSLKDLIAAWKLMMPGDINKPSRTNFEPFVPDEIDKKVPITEAVKDMLIVGYKASYVQESWRQKFKS